MKLNFIKQDTLISHLFLQGLTPGMAYAHAGGFLSEFSAVVSGIKKTA